MLTRSVPRNSFCNRLTRSVRCFLTNICWVIRVIRVIIPPTRRTGVFERLPKWLPKFLKPTALMLYTCSMCIPLVWGRSHHISSLHTPHLCHSQPHVAIPYQPRHTHEMSCTHMLNRLPIAGAVRFRLLCGACLIFRDSKPKLQPFRKRLVNG